MIDFPPPKKISERVNRLFFPDDSVKCGESYRQGGKKKKEQEKKPSSFYQKQSRHGKTRRGSTGLIKRRPSESKWTYQQT
jgi:hypothetical protein